MRRDVFQAIADPTRREILGLLSKQRMNLNTLADNFDISRPAISKQIKILTECGLIIVRRQGRERYCEAQMQELSVIAEWLEQYRQFWNFKLDALGDFLEQENTTIKHKPTKKHKHK